MYSMQVKAIVLKCRFTSESHYLLSNILGYEFVSFNCSILSSQHSYLVAWQAFSRLYGA